MVSPKSATASPSSTGNGVTHFRWKVGLAAAGVVALLTVLLVLYVIRITEIRETGVYCQNRKGVVDRTSFRKEMARAFPESPGLSAEFASAPIDVVYTWVDGGDPAWQEERERVAATYHSDNRMGENVQNRFRDNGELYVSVNLTIRHMGSMLRNVYIVTKQQTPWWYSQEQYPNVHIVDVATLFDPCVVQPCYNSNVIEMYLHRIKGLSRWFVYFNDDIFVTRPVTKRDFFNADDMPKFFASARETCMYNMAIRFMSRPESIATSYPSSMMYFMGRIYTEIEMQKSARARGLMPNPLHFMCMHAPYVVGVPEMEELLDRNAAIVEEAARNQFREPNDLVVMAFMYPNWMVDNRRGVRSGSVSAIYVGFTDEHDKSEARVRNMFSGRYIFGCVNDVQKVGHPTAMLDLLVESSGIPPPPPRLTASGEPEEPEEPEEPVGPVSGSTDEPVNTNTDLP